MSVLRGSHRFAAALLLSATLMTFGTTHAMSSTSQQLAGQQEAAVVGGSGACDFAEGFGIGLGVAGIFGCIPCGAGSLVLGVVHLVAC